MVWLAEHRAAFRPACVLAVLAMVLPALLSMLVPGVWSRMALNAVVLIAAALLYVPLPWRELFRPSVRRVVQGVAAAVVLYVAGAVVVGILLLDPRLAQQIATVYSWRDAIAPALVPFLLPLIVAGEEIVWRNAITLPLAARFGPWRGIVLGAGGFALAHITMGVPMLLLAAFGAGAFWGILVIRHRSAVPAFVSHLVWDVVVMFWLPYTKD